jgi:hypothetical protein
MCQQSVCGKVDIGGESIAAEELQRAATHKNNLE